MIDGNIMRKFYSKKKNIKTFFINRVCLLQACEDTTHEVGNLWTQLPQKMLLIILLTTVGWETRSPSSVSNWVFTTVATKPMVLQEHNVL